MKQRLPRKKDQIQPLHKTYALADVARTDPESGTTTPTEAGVRQAKDWVDTNEK